MTAKRTHVFVSGDVQGVGFRWYAREEAMRRGLTGFVRNLADGRVEAAFQGDPDGVDEMVAWCRRGPRLARVDRVDARDEEPSEDTGFAMGAESHR